MKTLVTRDIEFVAFEKQCVNFNDEFLCPHCGKRVFRVCVNLGMMRDKETRKNVLYCTGHGFPEDCSAFGCPKYGYNAWPELENYRLNGLLEAK